MKRSVKKGVSFGITSGVITTLGLIVGLHAGTHSRLIVLGGILMIAIADAFSDALGIHISEESVDKHTTREIWQSTFSAFFFKFIIALSFVIPVLIFELSKAVYISIIWGLLLISVISTYVAKERREDPWKVIAEHLFIAGIVIILTHLIGDWIAGVFR